MNIQEHAVKYRLSITCRIFIACILGYISTRYFTLVSTIALTHFMPRAETIFLAAMLGILFFIIFFLSIFIIQSVKKTILYGVVMTCIFYGLAQIIV
ncbi:hypothetical protein [Acinetobacter nectaris]|uniref:hypothetical protein n=1 Tax=Acinetobacter nectaris TaxID=1219382 RepID=UPI001F2FE2EE|nr:hypothetical protein [Acinetobacter nectaris]MCF8999497.1 hypothetical protein [Acinetobacter nectaris]MCF9028025.1 hypothetical protein [Acinetobacter nectaris]